MARVTEALQIQIVAASIKQNFWVDLLDMHFCGTLGP